MQDNTKTINNRIGIAKGKIKSPDDLDEYNDEIAALFGCVDETLDNPAEP